MPAKTELQRKAMAAEYGRRKKGGKPKLFKGMSLAQLREWITATPRKKKRRQYATSLCYTHDYFDDLMSFAPKVVRL